MIYISRQQMVYLVSFLNTYYFETQLRVSPECPMLFFFSHKTESKFVLKILVLSRILLILIIILMFAIPVV